MKTNTIVRIVGVGGGHGLSTVLRGLKRAAIKQGAGGADWDVQISAVVTTADNGGSTGRLRRHLGIPAVGDIRNCMAALSDSEPPLCDLFQYRFRGGNGLQGQVVGNLILAAYCEEHGSLAKASQQASGLLHASGRVLPVTDSPVTLCAAFADGSVVRGEAQIPLQRGRITRVWLEPCTPPASGGVLQSLVFSDLIVLGPGSLYTSVVPNLLVDGVADAIRLSSALKVYVCNLMTQPGETDGFTAADHLRVLSEYLEGGLIDVCILSSGAIPDDRRARYAALGAAPVRNDVREIGQMGTAPLAANLLSREDCDEVKHDCDRLGELLLLLARRQRPELAVKRSPTPPLTLIAR
ncbi:MAG: uridine diphosphate-N-acetylglucosamine-binding protein YvcK [Candidatus Schekmanbacteria bacterium]|nr:uridine diphosphate-N-acetylglucosamine-binding protein YvcK [Candidatus Schekmanbacteria bacterium]